MKHSSFVPALAVALALACSNSSPKIGQLSARLSAAPVALATTDVPLPGVKAIRVKVTAVRAHSVDGGWVTLSTTPAIVDLLALPDAGVDLGLANLPDGTVTQIRLVVEPLGNVLVTDAGIEVPLVVPSGSESGIKIIGPWEVGACQETALTLQLDGPRSIWAHSTGAGEEWILRPLIRTVAAEEPGTCEAPTTCDPTQCRSGRCEASGDHCAPAGATATCAENVECFSNVCDEGACAPVADGSECRDSQDCAPVSSTCTAGRCQQASPPPM